MKMRIMTTTTGDQKAVTSCNNLL